MIVFTKQTIERQSNSVGRAKVTTEGNARVFVSGNTEAHAWEGGALTAGTT